MTMTAPINTINTSNLSASFKTRPHGFDRAIESVGTALVKWSHARMARSIVSPDEYLRLAEAQWLKQERESEALRITQRMGL